MPTGAERFYHDVSLRGPVPDRLLLRLPDHADGPGGAVPGSAALADRIADLAREHARAFFAREAVSFAYAQSFAWLDPLARREDGRHVVAALWAAWAADHGRYGARAWAPSLSAARTEHMLRHAPLLLEGRDGPAREGVFGTLIRQTRHLARAARKGQLPEPRVLLTARAAIGTLALPLAAEQERQVKAPLTSALQQIAGGRMPDGLGDPTTAIELGRTLHALQHAYAVRGLTPPPGLPDALAVLRLLLGALRVAPGAGLAVLPGGTEGPPNVIDALSPLDRPEAAPLLAAYGLAALRAGGTSVHVTGEAGPGGAFCLSDGAARLVTAAGAPGPGLRAVDPAQRDWSEALGTPAAAATLDADGFGAALMEREDDAEGSVVTLTRQGPCGTHTRRLFLRADGGALIGEDSAFAPDLTYRFPLHPDVTARPAGQERVILTLPSGRSWRVETAQAELRVEEGIYSGGGVPRRTEQLVLTAAREGVRWAIRRG